MKYNADPPDPYSLPKLRLFSMVAPHLSEPPDISTPPFQTSASIPFRWEEQPGKPRRSCTDQIITSSTYPTTTTRRNTTTLDLPPRLVIVESAISTTKPSSPTRRTVVDDHAGECESVVSSISYGFTEELGLFDGDCGGEWSWVDDENGGGMRRRLLVGGESEGVNGGGRRFGVTGNRKRKGRFVISQPSKVSMDAGFTEEKWRKMVGNSSVSKVTRSHFWAKIYEGFKQVLPWRKKPKMESYKL